MCHVSSALCRVKLMIFSGVVQESVKDSIRATVTALRQHWRCFDVWQTGPDHVPDLVFSPPADWPPAQFPTKDYYLGKYSSLIGQNKSNSSLIGSSSKILDSD